MLRFGSFLVTTLLTLSAAWPNEPSDESAAAASKALRFLSEPVDQIELRGGDTLVVRPLCQPPPSTVQAVGSVAVEVLEGKDKSRKQKLTATEIAAYVPFEKVALERIEQLIVEPKQIANLKLAEAALQRTLRFHLATRVQPLKGKNGWSKWSNRLADELQRVRCDQLGLLVEQKKWPQAFAAANHYFATLAQQDDLYAAILTTWMRYCEAQVKAGNYVAARAAFERLQPNVLEASSFAVGKELKAYADKLVQKADAADDLAAIGLLQQAKKLWPRLPGLEDRLLKRKKSYQTLMVAVRRLPKNMSPATAHTDSERLAVDLVFEPLLRPIHTRGQGLRYESQLAERLPPVSPLKRRLPLRSNAYWSNGKQISSQDVRRTALLLSRSQQNAVWRELLNVPRVSRPSFEVEFEYRHGLLDPLFPLCFYILPPGVKEPSDQTLARKPLGSGPYVFAERVDGDGKPSTVFRANPHFVRTEQTLSLREIRLLEVDLTKAELQKHRPDVILSVPTDKLSEVTESEFNKISALRRRVVFLAVNHRMETLANTKLRRAIAHAIDRDDILKSCFRDGHDLPYHTSVNGIFPRESWTTCSPPRVPAQLSDTNLANTLLTQAKDELGSSKLTLKYPNDDLQVGKACKAIIDGFNAVAAKANVGVSLQGKPVDPWQLAKDIDRRDYELAYWYIDFPAESFWLWPMFDPRREALQPGGSNYLGYKDDAQLQTLLRKSISHCDFAKVQELMHATHAHLHERMPVIPLWQLHQHIAFRPRVDTGGPVDADRPLNSVARWKLK